MAAPVVSKLQKAYADAHFAATSMKSSVAGMTKTFDKPIAESMAELGVGVLLSTGVAGRMSIENDPKLKRIGNVIRRFENTTKFRGEFRGALSCISNSSASEELVNKLSQQWDEVEIQLDSLGINLESEKKLGPIVEDLDDLMGGIIEFLYQHVTKEALAEIGPYGRSKPRKQVKGQSLESHMSTRERRVASHRQSRRKTLVFVIICGALAIAAGLAFR